MNLEPMDDSHAVVRAIEALCVAFLLFLSSIFALFVLSPQALRIDHIYSYVAIGSITSTVLFPLSERCIRWLLPRAAAQCRIAYNAFWNMLNAFL